MAGLSLDKGKTIMTCRVVMMWRRQAGQFLRTIFEGNSFPGRRGFSRDKTPRGGEGVERGHKRKYKGHESGQQSFNSRQMWALKKKFTQEDHANLFGEYDCLRNNPQLIPQTFFAVTSQSRVTKLIPAPILAVRFYLVSSRKDLCKKRSPMPKLQN